MLYSFSQHPASQYHAAKFSLAKEALPPPQGDAKNLSADHPSIWYHVHDGTTVDLLSVHEVVDETDDGNTTKHGDSYKFCVSGILNHNQRLRLVNIPQFIPFASTFANSGKKLITVENNSYSTAMMLIGTAQRPSDQRAGGRGSP